MSHANRLGDRTALSSSNRFTSSSRKSLLPLLSATAAVLVPLWASAQVVVQQVEGGIAAGLSAYAPVEFNGSSSITGSPSYPGISLFAQGPNAAGTYSIHAAVAADNFYGPGSIGQSVISQAYVHSAYTINALGLEDSTPFMTNVLRVSGSTVAQVPALIGNNIRVSNHSYIYRYGTSLAGDSRNIEAIRRADFLINRDNVVWTAGAVSGNTFLDGDGAPSLGWQPRNGIAVRGDAGQTPFVPSAGLAGRQHADVWMSWLASYVAPQVGGMSAQIIRKSQLETNTAMGDARVVKSVLMTSADKVTRPANFNTSGLAWNPTTTNNLDAQGGAGMLSSAVYTGTTVPILNGGQRTLVPATGTAASSTLTAGNVPTLAQRGWLLDSIPITGASTVLFHVNGSINALSATLNWNWTSATANAGANIDVSNGALIAPDLSLELRRVTWSGTQYVLSAPLTNIAGTRDLDSDAAGATNDNVEHIFVNGATLPSGSYAFVIRGGSIATTAAFSYNIGTFATAAWNVDAAGTLTTNTNWLGSNAPTGVSTTAIFGSAITAPRTLTTGVTVIYGSVSFSGANAYTLNPTLASAQLQLSNGAFGNAAVTVNSGVHNIGITVNNTQGANFNFASPGARLNITGNAFQNNGPLVVSGAGGILDISTSITGTGSVTVTNGANLRLSNPGSASVNNVLLTQDLTITGTPASRGTVSLTGATVPPAGPRTILNNLLVPASLTIGNDAAPLGSRIYFGVLDLGSNDAVFFGGSLANLRDMARAYLSGNGGIGSSSAGGAGVNQFTGIAIRTPLNSSSGFLDFNTFDGLTVAASDVVARYTYLGDTNLDGSITAVDFNALLNGFTNGLTGWENGDTNYDGVVNGIDYTNLLNAFGSQAGVILGTPPTFGGAIPEPTTLGLLLAGIPFLSRRRKA
jgi:hypothetical protein